MRRRAAATMGRMQPPTGSTPEPGERRRLDHPPSDRYAADTTASKTPDATVEAEAGLPARERILRGIAVGLAGAIAMTILGGPLSITGGLVGAAGLIGWLVGIVVRPGRPAAVAIALGSIVLGLLGIWLFAGIEGGVLGPIEYLADVQGLLVPIELVVAGGLAAAAA
jgi:hypothetical protein